MSLQRQIVAGFGILLVPVVLVALVALEAINQLGGAVEVVLQENERSLDAVAQMDVALERLDSAALLLLLGREEDAGTISDAALPAFESALEVAAGNLTIDGEDELVATVRAAFTAFESAYVRLEEADGDGARTAYAEQVVPAFERTRAGLTALREANQGAARLSGEQARAKAQTAFWMVALGAALALLVGVWGALKLSRQIAQPYG